MAQRYTAVAPVGQLSRALARPKRWYLGKLGCFEGKGGAVEDLMPVKPALVGWIIFKSILEACNMRKLTPASRTVCTRQKLRLVPAFSVLS
jgi:hypothetical protein